MRIFILIFSFFYFLSGYKIEVGCEYYRPYVDKIDGKIVGSGYEIAKKVLEEANVSFVYKIEPWARVYYKGLHKKNYMVGCLGRTKERENKFYWIGPMEKGISLYFWALKDNNKRIKSLDDLKKYKIACIKNTYAEEFLKSAKFPKNGIKVVIYPKQLVLMLKNKRVDFVLINKEQLKEAAKKLNINLSDFKKVFFAFKVQNYLAFSKKTPKEIFEKIKKAYNKLKLKGKIELK